MSEHRDLDDIGLEVAVLRQARAGLSPSRAERARTLSSLGAALTALPLPAGPGDVAPIGDAGSPFGDVASLPSPPSLPLGELVPGASGFVRAAHGFSMSAMVSGVVAGIVAGAAAGFAVGTSVGSSDAPPPVVAPAPVAPKSESRDVRNDAKSTPQVEPLPDPVAPSGAHEPTGRGASGAASAKSHEPRESDEKPTGSAPPTVYDELSSVRRAQSALKRGDAAFALGLMADLDQSHPRGALLAERNVTKVLALCQLGRTAEATAIAKRLLNGNGDADLYRRRLATSCANVKDFSGRK